MSLVVLLLAALAALLSVLSFVIARQSPTARPFAPNSSDLEGLQHGSVGLPADAFEWWTTPPM